MPCYKTFVSENWVDILSQSPLTDRQGLEGCISCYQEKRNEKIWNKHSIMANLNFVQDVAIKWETKHATADIVATSYPL